MKTVNTLMIITPDSIVITGKVDVCAASRNKAKLAEEQAKAAIANLFQSRCEYLADLITAAYEEKPHDYILHVCPLHNNVLIVTTNSCLYQARGFEACENFLLDLLN